MYNNSIEIDRDVVNCSLATTSVRMKVQTGINSLNDTNYSLEILTGGTPLKNLQNVYPIGDSFDEATPNKNYWNKIVSSASCNDTILTSYLGRTWLNITSASSPNDCAYSRTTNYSLPAPLRLEVSVITRNYALGYASVGLATTGSMSGEVIGNMPLVAPTVNLIMAGGFTALGEMRAYISGYSSPAVGLNIGHGINYVGSMNWTSGTAYGTNMTGSIVTITSQVPTSQSLNIIFGVGNNNMLVDYVKIYIIGVTGNSTLGAEQSNIISAGNLSVTLISPTTNQQYNPVAFTINATPLAGQGVINYTLYVWNATSGVLRFTNTSTTSANSTTIYNYINQTGQYKWNALVWGGESQNESQWSLTNATFNFTYYNPSVIWNYQIPTNLTSTNGILLLLNITYNITNGTSSLNLSTITLTYKSNSTDRSEVTFINGTGITWETEPYTSNISETFLWQLDENEFLPGTFNVPDELTDDTLHTRQTTLTQANDYIVMRFFNMTNNTRYNFFEIMSNSSASQRIYYCNSSYGFGADAVPDISTSPRCFQVATIPAGQPYDHTHSVNSKHQVVSIFINVSSGTISTGNVKVTPTGYFALRGNTGVPNRVFFYTVPNITRADQMQLTINDGGTFANQVYTVDAHLHQFDLNTSLYYYACANDTLNNQNCSDIKISPFGLANIPPTSPYVFSPTETVYRGNISINWTASNTPLVGTTIVQYNVSLLDANFTRLQTIAANVSTNLSYLWDTTSITNGVADGQYIIRVTATDSNGQWALGNSMNFTVDNTAPLINWTTAPANGSILSITSVNLTVNVTDQNFASVILYLNKTDYTVLVSNPSLSHIFSINDGKALAYATACDVVGNCNTTDVRYFTVDTVPPVITIYSPVNGIYNYSTILLNASFYDTTLQQCWYSWNATNTSLVCGTNVSITYPEGYHNLWVYANDSANTVSTVNVSFWVDTTAPNITIISPLNGTYINHSNVNFTTNISSIGSTFQSFITSATYPLNARNLGGDWLDINNIIIGGSGSANTTTFPSSRLDVYNFNFSIPSTAFINGILVEINRKEALGSNNIFDDGVNIIKSNGGIGTQDKSKFTEWTTSFSTISYGNLTDLWGETWNYTDINSANFGVSLRVDGVTGTASVEFIRITVNYTLSNNSLPLSNATITITNQSGLVNQTTITFSTPVWEYLWGIPISLIDGVYNWWVNVFDQANNQATSENNTVTIDTTNSLVQITYPQAIAYTTNVSALNYTVSDTNLNTCWYSLNLGATNTSVTCGTNLTGLTSNEGSNTWKVWANDSAGNVNSSSVTFTKDTLTPLVQFVANTEPNNSQLNRRNIYINVTATDVNLNNITINVYSTMGIYSWATTAASPNTQNFTITLDGTYYFNATACDTFGRCNSTETRTISVDAVAPIVNIYSPQNRFYDNSNILINLTITELNPYNCWYNKNGGVNTSSSCNTSNLLGEVFVPTNTVQSPSGVIAQTCGVVINITNPIYIKYANVSATNAGGGAGQVYRITNESGTVFDSATRVGKDVNFTGTTLYPKGIYYIYGDGGFVGDLNMTFVPVTTPSFIWKEGFLAGSPQGTQYFCNINGLIITEKSSLTFPQGNNTFFFYANDTAGSIGYANSSFIVDTIYPTVSILSPANNTNITTPTLTVDISANDTNLANVTTSIYKGGVFQSSQVTPGSANITFAFGTVGIYTINAIACDYANNCFTSPTNTYPYTATLTSTVVFNSSVYETQGPEGYGINITWNNVTYSNVTARFYWNGTEYPIDSSFVNRSTAQAYFHSSHVIPLGVGNKSFFWDFSFDNGVALESSGLYGQMVNLINVSLCDGSLTNKILNISFIDEVTSVYVVNATLLMTGTYWVGDGSVTKPFSYTSSLGHPSYTFCNNNMNLTSTMSYAYGGLGPSVYPQRTSVISERWNTNSQTNHTFPLLKVVDGASVNIYTVTASGGTVTGAYVTVSSVAFPNLSQGYSDGSGVINFWLNPITPIFINGNKTGVGTGNLSITPSLGSYYLILGGVPVSGNVTPVYNQDSIAWFTPGMGPLTPGTNNFTFNVVSSQFLIGWYNFTIFNETTQLYSVEQSSVGLFNVTVPITNVTVDVRQKYHAVGRWSPALPNGTVVPIYTFTINWLAVDDTSGNDWSLVRWGADFRRYVGSGLLFGLDGKSLNLLVFILIFGITGILSFKFGFTSPAMVAVILAITTVFFDVGFGLIEYAPNIALFKPASVVTVFGAVILYLREGQY